MQLCAFIAHDFRQLRLSQTLGRQFVVTFIGGTLSLQPIADAAVCTHCTHFLAAPFLQSLGRHWLRGARLLFISLFKASSSKMSDALRVSEARYDITPSEGCKCHVFDEESF